MKTALYAVLALVMVQLISNVFGEEVTEGELGQELHQKGYGFVYNLNCRSRYEGIPGCVRGTIWQKCRYPEILPRDQDNQLPICYGGLHAIQEGGRPSSAVLKREKRGFGKKLRKRLRKLRRKVERIGKNVVVRYSSQDGFNAEVTG